MDVELKGIKGVVTINDVEYTAETISVEHSQITVDGVSKGEKIMGDITIKVEGSVETITTDSGDVYAEDVGSITTNEGDVKCGDVKGSVTTTEGDVKCEDVGGDVTTEEGDIIQG